MLRKLAKRITNNFGLKILAAAFALVLWLVVVNVEDPDKTQAFTIPVSIENSEYLTKMGKTFDILNNTDKISFTVTGKRSVMEELSESDFTAAANLENVNEDLTMVPITITASRYKNQIEISKKSTYMKISVENLVTEKFAIEAVMDGTPAAYCYVNKTLVSPKKVTVTGPESVVEKIDSARVTVNVDGAEESIATNGEIILLDASGKEISQERLSLNRKKAAVDVEIMMGKVVPLKFETTGEPADGYKAGKITGSVSEVRLVGAPEVLDNLETVQIASPQLDLTGVKKTFKVTVNLQGYLPEGITLAEGEPSDVEVEVEVIGQETKTFEVPAANIKIENLPDYMELKFDKPTITVKLSGFQEDLDEISAADLKGTVDASDVNAETKSVVVKLQGDYLTAAVIRAPVTVSVEKTNPDTDDNSNTEGGANTPDGEAGSADAGEQTQ